MPLVVLSIHNLAVDGKAPVGTPSRVNLQLVLGGRFHSPMLVGLGWLRGRSLGVLTNRATNWGLADADPQPYPHGAGWPRSCCPRSYRSEAYGLGQVVSMASSRRCDFGTGWNSLDQINVVLSFLTEQGCSRRGKVGNDRVRLVAR